MPDLLIQNGRVIDPANQRDEIADVLIRDGKIAGIERGISADGVEIVDAAGKVVSPGFIDMHVHLREPGFEGKETIESGTRAAAAGGFTSIIPMANTDPVIDTAADIKFILERARSNAVVNVFPIAAVTMEQKGEKIVEFGDLVHAGAIGFSDDGHPIMNNDIMRRALEYCAMFNVPILDHCQDLDLSGVGVMREGAVSTRLGLKGIPPVAESIQVARDVALAEYTGAQVHIQHISNYRSLALLQGAKVRQAQVTCEVTPHHLTMTDEDVCTYDTNYKMAPPLGTEKDRQALLAALANGLIDCIATDHAPHSQMDKDKVFDEAPFGVIGMEAAFPIVYTELVGKKVLTLPQLLEKMTINPARIMHLSKGTLSVGADADVTIMDPEWNGVLETSILQSRSRNCPYLGRSVQCRIFSTIVGGRVIYRDGAILA